MFYRQQQRTILGNPLRQNNGVQHCNFAHCCEQQWNHNWGLALVVSTQYHDRSQTLKSDKAKWSKLTRITRMAPFWGEIPMILRKSDEAIASSASVVATAMNTSFWRETKKRYYLGSSTQCLFFISSPGTNVLGELMPYPRRRRRRCRRRRCRRQFQVKVSVY